MLFVFAKCQKDTFGTRRRLIGDKPLLPRLPCGPRELGYILAVYSLPFKTTFSSSHHVRLIIP